MSSSIYFVLNGFVNGEQGMYAVEAGSADARRQADGWYFLPPGASDGVGPHESRDAAVKAERDRRRFFVETPDGAALYREIAEDDGEAGMYGENVVQVDRHAMPGADYDLADLVQPLYPSVSANNVALAHAHDEIHA